MYTLSVIITHGLYFYFEILVCIIGKFSLYILHLYAYAAMYFIMKIRYVRAHNSAEQK